MPIQGILDDNSFDTVGPTRFRYRTPTAFPLPDSHRVSVNGSFNAFPIPWAPTTCPIPDPHRVPVTGPTNQVSDPRP